MLGRIRSGFFPPKCRHTMSSFVKFLLSLIGLLIVAVAVAWIMGGESKKNSTRISIEAPPLDVFLYLVEGTQISKWAAGVESVGTFHGEAKPQDRVVIEDGKQVVWRDSVLRFQYGEMLSIQSKNLGIIRTLVFQLEENELGGTNVDYRVVESAAGLERFLFPLKASMKRTVMVDEMNRLRDLVESEVDFEPGERSQRPVAASSDSNDNADPSQANGATDGSSSVVPLGGATEDPAMPEKRKFESLFSTGR